VSVVATVLISSTGGEDVGGEDVGGEDVGGEDVGGEDVGGEDVEDAVKLFDTIGK